MTFRFQKQIAKILRRTSWQLRFFSWEANRRFRQSLTVSTKQGIYTVLPGENESIGRSLYCSRQYELDLMMKVMAFLRQHQLIPPKGQGTFLDVGANIGVVAIGMLHLGEVEKAIAVEPEPRNFSLLQHNVQQDQMDNRIICLPYAASDSESELLFELSGSNFGDHRVRANLPTNTTNERFGERFDESRRSYITVKGEKLDSLLTSVPDSFSQSVTMLWVDVQGYEGFVFSGAGNLLSRGVPVVAELWPYAIQRAGMSQAHFCNIAQNFWSNYWIMREGKFVQYSISTLETLFTELDHKGSSTNLIFTP